MRVLIYENEDYKLEKEVINNPLLMKQSVYYSIIPKINKLYMVMEVVGDKILAKFPEGLSFMGDNLDYWIDALISADKFIKEASPYL